MVDRHVACDGFAEKYTDLDEFDANYASPEESPERLNLVTCIVIQVIPGPLGRPEGWIC